MADNALPADALGDTDAILRLSRDGQPLPPLRSAPSALAQSDQVLLGGMFDAEEAAAPKRVYSASAKVPMVTIKPENRQLLGPKEMDNDRYRKKGHDFITKEKPKGRDATGQELYDAFTKHSKNKPQAVNICATPLDGGENIIIWRGRQYGLSNVIANVQNLAPALKAIVPLRVGHISFNGGGPMRKGTLSAGNTNVFHKSHMEGRDVDFFLPPAPDAPQKASEWYISGYKPKAHPTLSAQMALGIFFHSWIAVEHLWVVDDSGGRTFKAELRATTAALIMNVVYDKKVREAHLRALKEVAGTDQAKEYLEVEQTIRNWTKKESWEQIEAAVKKYVLSVLSVDPAGHTFEFHFRFIPDKINPCFGMADALTILLLKANDINMSGPEKESDDFEPPSASPTQEAMA